MVSTYPGLFPSTILCHIISKNLLGEYVHLKIKLGSLSVGGSMSLDNILVDDVVNISFSTLSHILGSLD